MVAANPRTTLHPAMIRQPPAAYSAKGQDFEMREPSKHANMSMSPTPTDTLSRTSSTDSHASGSGNAAGSVPVHQRGGGGNGGLCCGICAGLACFECLECCC
ncbi:hypothetical protein BPAE_0093g00010 [Botrytis paeoniae]|uniref:Cysteine-rich transmembrane CYSTM domain-containing protein n=1 Tax=Botrytis paeoniae TaxID=278948 RepID=A0A4Z1FMS1_9HELO|nr:hypothetical protein BPAE_0093g00010 [Botrytis paeoniae]